MKKTFGIIFGILLIAAGVLFAIEAFGIANINFSFDGWWTLFIIVPSIYGLITSKDKSGNIIFLAIGIYLLLAARGIIDYSALWKIIVPLIVIVMGVKIIVKTIKGDTAASDNEENLSDKKN